MRIGELAGILKLDYPYSKEVRKMSPVIATMTSKGQVTIPKEVRKALDLHQGDPILFEERDGVVTLQKRPRLDPAWHKNLASTLSEWEDDLDDDL
jgi:AbrB family looped-hinge helix DNA binding protein